jgi:outer membrane protein OmpA-like peptidoglycan-associated protein
MLSRLCKVFAVAGVGIVAAATAYAADPSVDDLIKALSPKPGVTRGSKPVLPGAAPTAPAAAPQAQASAPAASMTLTFTSGSAELTDAGKRKLDTLGAAISSAQLATFKFLIEGHTDTVGTPESNKTLSQKRADAVAMYLEQKFNIAAARIQTIGRGQDDLAVPTGPGVAELRNRRVQVINLGPV